MVIFPTSLLNQDDFNKVMLLNVISVYVLVNCA